MKLDYNLHNNSALNNKRFRHWTQSYVCLSNFYNNTALTSSIRREQCLFNNSIHDHNDTSNNDRYLSHAWMVTKIANHSYYNGRCVRWSWLANQRVPIDRFMSWSVGEMVTLVWLSLMNSFFQRHMEHNAVIASPIWFTLDHAQLN